MKTAKADLVILSPSTEAVISKRGVTFIRGQNLFVLSANEAKNLSEALNGNDIRGESSE